MADNYLVDTLPAMPYSLCMANNKRHTFSDLPVGTGIYYTGDMANQSGFGIVAAHRPPTQWTSGSVDIRMEDDRQIKAITLCMFDESVGRRFMTRAEYDVKRAASIAQMEAEYSRLSARREAVR